MEYLDRLFQTNKTKQTTNKQQTNKSKYMCSPCWSSRFVKLQNKAVKNWKLFWLLIFKNFLFVCLPTLFVCLFVCLLFVCLPTLFVCLFVCLLCLFVCLFVYFVCLFVYFVYLFAYFVCLFVLFVCLLFGWILFRDIPCQISIF